jgi:hypothetical protein
MQRFWLHPPSLRGDITELVYESGNASANVVINVERDEKAHKGL